MTKIDGWLACPALKNALEDLPKSERRKRFPPFCGVRRALRVTLACERMIAEACDQTGVQRAAVRAVVFREVLGYGFEDLLDQFHHNSSRGLCQIRPDTTKRADEALGLPVRGYFGYCRALLSRRGNILCCARILRAEALKISADPCDMTDEQLMKVFRAYNGSLSYATHALAYCRAFEETREEICCEIGV